MRAQLHHTLPLQNRMNLGDSHSPREHGLNLERNRLDQLLIGQLFRGVDGSEFARGGNCRD